MAKTKLTSKLKGKIEFVSFFVKGGKSYKYYSVTDHKLSLVKWHNSSYL